MRYLFGFLCVCALGAVPLVGCSETGDNGGSTGDVFPCTEQGIRDAIAEGGGPHTFACDGPTTVVTEAEIVIDNDVILDGGGDLTLDGNESHTVFFVRLCVEQGDFTPPDCEDVAVGLHGVTVTGGITGEDAAIQVSDGVDLEVTGSSVSGNAGRGIDNNGTLTLTDSIVSDNGGDDVSSGGGIFSLGTLTLTNSTVSGNTARTGGGIFNGGTLTLTNSTVSGNIAPTGGGIFNDGTLTVTNSLVDGDCEFGPNNVTESNGGNIESPGDTCGFDQPTDQVNVSAEDLKLGELAAFGAPPPWVAVVITTFTHRPNPTDPSSG